MSKILVTGVTGFVGHNLVERFSKDLFRCVVRDNMISEASDFFSVDSIDNDTDWSGAFDNINCVIHIAGLSHKREKKLEDFRCVNVSGTMRLASKAAYHGVKRFVFVSSIGVNGPSTDLEVFTPSAKVLPHNAYAQSKCEAESCLNKLAYETGLEVVIIRPTLVYGPDAPGNFGILTKLVKKFPILPFGLATNKRDFISVQNLADLLMICATHPNAAGHIFLASDGETVSIKHFTNAIAEGLGKKVFQLPIPVSLIRLVGKLIGKSAVVEQLFGNLQVDSSNIKEVLDWTPPLTMKQAMATLRDSGK
ncbi:NAD-dependent epimerase/dehydratase family protein [Shewanella sp. S23-S33]|uniref:NAD-dependent epimerase/dehydratase family protein n=1 Tax=Shewanella sp. S23-S33 TaxID=3342769 RepID=UPI00372D6711